jgi:23S rRNA (uracil1939-C5)-methyltransferase
MQVQKGISSKAPDGKVVFIPNVVPGDVIDVQTFKSASLIMKEKQFIFMNIQNTVPNLYEHFGVCVAMAKYEIQPTVVLQAK